MSGQVYEYLGTGSSPPTQTVWLDLTTNTEQIWSAGPGPTDTWLFTHDQDVDGYPIFSRGELFGTLVLVPNVNVILSGFGGDGNSYVGLAADKVIVGPGANFTMYGGLHGNELIIGPGATATFNEIPAPGPGGGVGSDFANLINSGTLSVGPQTANGGFATSLALGGPGFVQTTALRRASPRSTTAPAIPSSPSATSHKALSWMPSTKLSPTHQWEGVSTSFCPALTSPASTSIRAANRSPSGLNKQTATVTVNTAVLGSHVALLSYTAGGVHDTLVITDKIVAA